MRALTTIVLTLAAMALIALGYVYSGAFGVAAAAARQFWIIKHGIGMSAMPAWGATHEDPTIWSIVAFLQKLPTLTPQQYAGMTTDAASVHEEHEHTHAPDEP